MSVVDSWKVRCRITKFSLLCNLFHLLAPSSESFTAVIDAPPVMDDVEDKATTDAAEKAAEDEAAKIAVEAKKKAEEGTKKGVESHIGVLCLI